MVSDQRTGAYLSNLDHVQFLWFPKTTIQDFGQNGLSILSGLIIRTHIVGYGSGSTYIPKSYVFCKRYFVIGTSEKLHFT
jgi:hypothetical protein